MPDLKFLDDAEQWRERAEEARALADNMANATTKRLLHSIADTYDRLAKLAHEREDAQRGRN
jgi:hypothetical protein